MSTSRELGQPADGGSLVVVTGASAGLGRALLSGGPRDAHRVDVSRSGPPAGADAHIAADLADPGTWPRVGAAIGELVASRPWERITVFHNAGAIDPIGFAGEVPTDAYRDTVLLNSAAPQVLGHLVLEALREERVHEARRELVLLTSGAASSPYAGWSAYCAGKAAIEQWVRAVGLEQQERGGARVLALGPGVVATGMQERIRSTSPRDFPQVARFQRLHDQGVLLSPEESARQVWAAVDDPSLGAGTVTDVRQR